VKICVLGKPLSVNHAYVTTKQGRRFLSKEGVRYKQQIRADVLLAAGFSAESMREAARIADPQSRLRVSYTFHLPDLLNSGWPKKAKSRYKRLDLSNLLKILEDGLFEALGVDDSNVFEILLKKEESEAAWTDIEVTVLENDGRAEEAERNGAPRTVP